MAALKHTLLEDAAADGAGSAISVVDKEHITLSVFAPTSTLTVKIYGSNGKTVTEGSEVILEPDWDSAISESNQYQYIATVDTSTSSVVDGTTGYSATASTLQKIITVNTAGLRFVNAIVSGYTSGSVSVVADGFTYDK